MDIIVRAWNSIKKEYVKETKKGIAIKGNLFSNGDFFKEKAGLSKEEIDSLEFELSVNKRDENNQLIFENDLIEVIDGALLSFEEEEDGTIVLKELLKKTYRVYKKESIFFIELVKSDVVYFSPPTFVFPVGENISYKIVGNNRGENIE